MSDKNREARLVNSRCQAGDELKCTHISFLPILRPGRFREKADSHVVQPRLQREAVVVVSGFVAFVLPSEVPSRDERRFSGRRLPGREFQGENVLISFPDFPHCSVWLLEEEEVLSARRPERCLEDASFPDES